MESNFEWITANGDIGIRFFHSIDDAATATRRTGTTIWRSFIFWKAV